MGELDFLLGVRDDLRQGAVRFRSDDGDFLATDEGGVPALTDLPELLSLAARAEDDDVELDDLRRLVHIGSSLGGARPKAHVVTGEGRVAIAKFPSDKHDTWDVLAWEKVALDVARAAGITVPNSRLLRLAGRAVLVIERFDRGEDGGRIGYVSAMTMLEASDGDQRSYVDIAEVIEENSPTASADLEQLWRRLVVNILISNTDDHLRNHGFLQSGVAAWRLSPAFDLNPDPGPGPKFLSTAIDDAYDDANVHHALQAAGNFRLTGDRASDVLAQVSGAVAGWAATATRHGISKAAITQMAPAFAPSSVS